MRKALAVTAAIILGTVLLASPASAQTFGSAPGCAYTYEPPGGPWTNYTTDESYAWVDLYRTDGSVDRISPAPAGTLLPGTAVRMVKCYPSTEEPTPTPEPDPTPTPEPTPDPTPEPDPTPVPETPTPEPTPEATPTPDPTPETPTPSVVIPTPPTPPSPTPEAIPTPTPTAPPTQELTELPRTGAYTEILAGVGIATLLLGLVLLGLHWRLNR